jgi:type IV secretory pathway VirB2 component (pilin)
MNWKLMFLCVMILSMFTTSVLAQVQDLDDLNLTTEQTDAINEISGSICLVLALVQWIGGGIGAIAAVVIGIMMMYTNDPAEKSQLKTRLTYVIIGALLIFLAPAIIKTFGLVPCGSL